MMTRRTLPMLVLLAIAAAGARADDPADDPAKRIAEIGAERVLEDTGAPPAEDPRVAPGRVRGHADQDAAALAAQASGKPVLVFQLLGRLDEELC